VNAGTIFHGLLSPEVSWYDLTDTLTPVDQGASGLFYKREDTFAPLGYGGINGSKLRQLIWLMRPMNDGSGVVTACSVLSPQSSMTAIVGRHYGLDVTVILGATHYDSAVKHENVRIAVRAGARLEFIKVAYNPALQRACRAWQDEHNLYRVPYGITTPEEARDREVAEFHLVAAPQVVNIPSGVRTLIIPFGSGNSVTGILTGLAKYGPGSISRIVLVGIGPNRLAWLHKRLDQIGGVLGLDIPGMFNWRPHQGSRGDMPDTGPVLMEHYDLHGIGYVKYSDRRPWRQDGIDFHPTYEGKVMKWLNEESPHWYKPADGTSLFWIVGSEPHLSAMEGKL
jgi:1-aminocyclopropane-1-carboxylate deaminase/D-cysteine desulfhydrase-like pyridoxal-dependent ACC family enzyme